MLLDRSRPLRTVGRVALTAALLLACARIAALHAREAAVPGITYVEQPEQIAPSVYVETWPDLRPYVARLSAQDNAGARADLQRAVEVAAPSDGALNLLSQLERRDGRLDEAEVLIGKALSMNPNQHLHHFQQAMIFYARLRNASGGLDRWELHGKTRDAYRRAFELDPKPVPYRYYLAYTRLQEPWIAGGDKREALRLAQQGIDMGQQEFYVVRADVRSALDEVEAAFADYDESMRAGIFKLNSFLAAGRLALKGRQPERARRYFDYAVRCRPDSPRAHEGLGDYFAAVNETQAAVRAYEAALQADTAYSPARDKLRKLRPFP